MKKLERIQKIYKVRVQTAQREAGAARNVRQNLENEHAQMEASLVREVDACDSVELAPFDFAARYYRAVVDAMREKRAGISVAAQEEISAMEVLREKFREQKEFDIYANRRRQMLHDEQRRKEDEKSRAIFSNGRNAGGFLKTGGLV